MLRTAVRRSKVFLLTRGPTSLKPKPLGNSGPDTQWDQEILSSDMMTRRGGLYECKHTHLPLKCL